VLKTLLFSVLVFNNKNFYELNDQTVSADTGRKNKEFVLSNEVLMYVTLSVVAFIMND
jgi:hypothetical protein